MGFENIKGIIFDIDGVLEFQGKVCPGAVETVERLRARDFVLRFLTNSTLKSRRSCAEGLRRAGFAVLDSEVITASYATAVYLSEHNPRSCWVMLEREGLEEFTDFCQDAEDPEYVIIGDNRSRFDFEHLNQALRMLLRGAHLIGMQPEMLDRSLGEVELNVGAWTSLLERASGVSAIYIGKPSPYVFDLTVRTMNLDKSQILVVGDQVCTDIQGARNFGLRSVLLRTGEFRPEHLDDSVQPNAVLDRVEDVLELVLPC